MLPLAGWQCRGGCRVILLGRNHGRIVCGHVPDVADTETPTYRLAMLFRGGY
jgi:hypothetical protein